MNGETFIIIGLISFLTPIAILSPWWIKEVRKIGDETHE